MSEFIQFLERVKTYSFGKWTLRSSKITPYHLASWGFICVGEDLFSCSMCEQQISAAHLPFYSEVEEEQTIDPELLVKNFFLNMSAVHKPECAFCEANVKSSVFFELSDAFLSSNIADLYNLHLKSYNELENLPQLDISFLDIIPSEYKFLLSEEKKFINIRQLDIPRSLSVFGWRFDADSVSGSQTLNCDYCGRSVDISHVPVTDKQRVMKVVAIEDGFNPFEEHKYFCKWGMALADFLDPSSNGECEEGVDSRIAEEKQEKKLLSKEQISSGVVATSPSGWIICLSYLMEAFALENKKSKSFERVDEIRKMQLVIGKIHSDFKNLSENFQEQYKDIQSKCESLNIETTPTASAFKLILQQNRQTIDDLLKDIDITQLNAHPSKKLKQN